MKGSFVLFRAARRRLANLPRLGRLFDGGGRTRSGNRAAGSLPWSNFLVFIFTPMPSPDPPSHFLFPFPPIFGQRSLCGAGREERMSQWGQQETRELIAIRAELERDFTLSRRNKTVWEAVALRMREKGYRRTTERCKCKWKNLVNRYKDYGHRVRLATHANFKDVVLTDGRVLSVRRRP